VSLLSRVYLTDPELTAGMKAVLSLPLIQLRCQAVAHAPIFRRTTI
jgi:hypothetical protein